MQSSVLILPGHPLFNQAVSTVPPDWKEKSASMGGLCNFVVDAETRLMRPANNQELQDYVHGGEYDERLSQMDDLDEPTVEHWDLDNGVVSRW